MASCAKHVGDIGPLEPYRPCNKPAVCTVNRGPFSGGLPFWPACREHGREMRDNGLDVEGLEEEDDRIAFEASKKKRIARLYEKSRAVLALAYRYAAESNGALASSTSLADTRVTDCIGQVRLYRLAIARLRIMHFEDAETAVLVGAANDFAACEDA